MTSTINWELFSDSLIDAHTILRNNQYSKHFIERIINATLNEIITCAKGEHRSNNGSDKPNFSAMMPIECRGKISEDSKKMTCYFRARDSTSSPPEPEAAFAIWKSRSPLLKVASFIPSTVQHVLVPTSDKLFDTYLRALKNIGWRMRLSTLIFKLVTRNLQARMLQSSFQYLILRPS